MAIDTQDDWNMASQIIQSVQRPIIPEKTMQITDFGAIGDGVTDVRPAIIKAIDAASMMEEGELLYLPRVVL